METTHYKCEMCPKVADGEKQLRHENWIKLQGGSLHGLSVWLEKPRSKKGSFMLTVGYKTRRYDFCSVGCLVKALKGKESI